MTTTEEILKIFKENNITGYQIERDFPLSPLKLPKHLLHKGFGFFYITILHKTAQMLNLFKYRLTHDTKITEIYAKIIKVMRFNEAKGNAGKFE